jgi:5-carboxymethyl-2-hydroxymuconate isomerase
MPQLILEYSANVLEQNNFTQLFKTCHEILAQKLPADLGSCKSRAIQHNIYYVGNGEPNNAFVHVSLKCMEGRSEEILQNMTQEILNVLQNHFAGSLKKLNLQISLQLGELSAKRYFRVSSEK